MRLEEHALGRYRLLAGFVMLLVGSFMPAQRLKHILGSLLPEMRLKIMEEHGFYDTALFVAIPAHMNVKDEAKPEWEGMLHDMKGHTTNSTEEVGCRCHVLLIHSSYVYPSHRRELQSKQRVTRRKL